MSTPRLADKVTVITGVGGGQGRAAAALFARQGARVFGCDIDPDAAERVQAELAADGLSVEVRGDLDLVEPGAATELIEWVVGDAGRVDVLYNLAANYVRGKSLLELTEDDWEYSFRHELSISFHALQAAARAMIPRRCGSIVNVASVAGTLGSGRPGNAPGALVHGVFKAALIRFSACAAIELAPFGIRVNSLSPGPINTANVAERIAANPEVGERFAATTLLGRLGSVDDMAAAAVFLASDESAFVTGIDLPVDGGFLASGGLGVPAREFTRLYDETIGQVGSPS